MEAAARAMEEATKRMEEASQAAITRSIATSNSNSVTNSTPGMKTEESPAKRMLTEEEKIMAHMGMPSAHLKITSRSRYQLYEIPMGFP